MLRYLFDEHLLHMAEPLYRHAPAVTAWRIGYRHAPPRGTPDPAVLDWCEEHQFILVTQDASTMPPFLADRLAQGRHTPGIFVVNRSMPLLRVLEILTLAASASLPDEHRDQIRYLASL